MKYWAVKVNLPNNRINLLVNRRRNREWWRRKAENGRKQQRELELLVNYDWSNWFTQRYREVYQVAAIHSPTRRNSGRSPKQDQIGRRKLMLRHWTFSSISECCVKIRDCQSVFTAVLKWFEKIFWFCVRALSRNVTWGLDHDFECSNLHKKRLFINRPWSEALFSY